MDITAILLAFSAGLLSFLSPCVLPLIPAYITYLTGASIDNLDDKKSKIYVLYKSLGFIIGFSTVFIILGASVSSIGKLFLSNQYILRRIGGILVIILGLHMTGLLKIKYFYYEKRLFTFKRIGGPFGSALMGIAFAAGWTPCIGPILSSILVYAGSTETMDKGILLLAIYSLGLAIPFIITAFAIGSMSKQIQRFSKYFPVVTVVSGIIMIIMGIMIFTNKVNILSRFFNYFNF